MVRPAGIESGPKAAVEPEVFAVPPERGFWGVSLRADGGGVPGDPLLRGVIDVPDAPRDPVDTPETVTLSRGPVDIAITGDGPLVIALHGLPGKASHLRALSAALAEGARVLRVDLPGFGDTPARVAPGHRVEDLAAFVDELCEALALEPAVVLGHSLGCAIATSLATDWPRRVRALALISSVGGRPHRSLRGCGIPFAELADRLDREPVAGVLADGHAHLARIGMGGMRDDGVLQTIRLMASIRLDAHADRLRRLRQPTFPAWAADDASIEPELAAETARIAPPARGCSCRAAGITCRGRGRRSWRTPCCRGSARGARSGGRTRTPQGEGDFKSPVSACSTIRARATGSTAAWTPPWPRRPRGRARRRSAPG